MKKLFLVAAILASQHLRADLLIKKDGKSSWLVSYEQKADSISYRTAADGSELTIPLSDVDLILPSVQPDTPYTPEQADKALDTVNRASGKYPTLRKQMEMLKQQWQQVKDPDTEADGKINHFVQQFRDSDKSPKAFQDIAVQMEMLALRDAVGTFTAKIKKTVAEMQQETFATAKLKIDAMAGAERQTLANYLNLRRLVSEVKLSRATAEQKKYLNEVQEKCRKASMEAGLKASQTAFFGNKTVDGYLASMAILCDLKQNDVPVSDTEKADVDRYMKVMLTAAKTACKAYDFDNKGFPLDAQDRKLLDGKKFDSIRATSGMPLVEQCYLIATDIPADAKQGDLISFPVRLIFNRTPVPGRKYNLVADFSVPGSSKREMREISMQGMRAGHVSTEIKVTVPRLAPNLGDGPTRWNGITGLSLVLTYQDERTPVAERADLVAASGACWIGLGAPIAIHVEDR